MSRLIERHHNGISDGKVIALGAERGENTGSSVVDGSHNEQRDNADRKEYDALGNQNGQQIRPVDGLPVELDERQENERRQGERTDERVQSFGLVVRDDFG